MALDPRSPAEHNGRVDWFGPPAETGAAGKAAAIGAFRLYDVSPIKTMTNEIQAAIRGFREIILGGIPVLLQRNETAFLSFMCSVAAVDALAAYRYTTNNVGVRFVDFIKNYFPPTYSAHADNLYKLRCRLLHNFSPAYFTLTHAAPSQHFQASHIGDTVLSDDAFFADLRSAAEAFFDEVQADINRQKDMNARLLNVNAGGAIFYE